MQNILEQITFFQNKVAPAKLLVVTKGRSKAELEEVLKSSVTMIGENKLQEIQRKYDLSLFHEMKRKGVSLHFIGHVQSNKVKKIVRLCDVIQSVDSIDLAKKINTEAKALKKIMPIFLELSFTSVPQKFGFQQEDLDHAVEEIKKLPNVSLLGFMTMGREGDPLVTREVFQKCKNLVLKYKLPEVSMGMSDDYEIALEEGATMVRLGRIIFE